MDAVSRLEVFQKLIDQSECDGYLLSDDIINISTEYGLSIQDVDWLSNSLATRGVLFYESDPDLASVDKNKGYGDYAQIDYDVVYDRVIEIAPELKTFINEIRRIVPPQKGEMGRLKYLVQEGNSHARERVIQMHLRNAVRIAFKRVEQYDCDMVDTLQDACVGLVMAADRYDPDLNGPFNSYASTWILQNISRCQATQRPTVYYPVQKKDEYFATYPKLKRYGCTACRKVWKCRKARTLIKETLECSEDQVDDIFLESMPLDSLEETYEIFSKNIEAFNNQKLISIDSLYEAFSNENPLYAIMEQKMIQNEIQKNMLTLKPREQQILKERYGFEDGKEKTLQEVGEKFGVTRERIRQIEVKAIKKLKNPKRKLKELV